MSQQRGWLGRTLVLGAGAVWLACAGPSPPTDEVPLLAPGPAAAEDRPALPSGTPEPNASPNTDSAQARAQLVARLESARHEPDAPDAPRSRELLAEALPHLEAARGPADPLVAEVERALARYERIEAERRRAAQRAERHDLALALTRSGVERAAQGQLDAAIDALEQAASLWEAGEPDPLALGTCLSYLGRLRAERGDPEAEPTLLRALELLEPELGRLDPTTLATRARLERLRAAMPANAAE